jgi:predicted phage tail protein
MAVGTVLRATLVGVLVLAAAACGDDDDSTSAGGAAQSLCSSLQSLDSTVTQITDADVNPETTTIGDVENAVDEVQSDLQDVQTSGADLASSLKTALQTAFNNLQDTVKDLPSDETVAEVGSSVEDAVQQLDTAWTNALDALNCSSGS